MGRLTIVIALVLTTSGCQEIMVRKDADRLNSTVPDLYGDQVINNLAMAAADPYAIPYFGIANQGTTTNQRALSAGYTAQFSSSVGSTLLHYFFLAQQSVPLTANDQSTQTFQTNPVQNPDNLVLLQAAFHVAVGRGDVMINEQRENPLTYRALLERFYDSRHMYDLNRARALPDGAIPPTQSNGPAVRYREYVLKDRCWVRYSRGQNSASPRACHIGEYGDTYVWVIPGCEKEFRQFTLAILDIATFDLKPKQPKGTPTSYGAPEENVFESSPRSLFPTVPGASYPPSL
jgi:hypothetical protein